MTNLRQIKSTPEAEVEIKDETGAPTGIFFTLAGPTHPKRKAVVFAAQRRAQTVFQKTGKFALDGPEEQAAQNIDNLVAFTLGWRVAEGSDWTLEPYSDKAARDILEDDSMAWLADQLQTALGEKERFMTRSATA
jgi:hypothetical protein